MIVLIWLTSSDSCAARGRLIDPTLLEKPEPESAMTTAFYSHPDCRGHDMGAGHPECSARLDAIEDHLIATGLDVALEQREAPMVALSDLGARPREPLRRRAARRPRASRHGGVPRAIDPDTIAAPGTWARGRVAPPAPPSRPPTRSSTAHSATPFAACDRPAITRRATRRWAFASSTTSPSRRAMRSTCAASSASRSSTSTSTTATAPRTSSPATSAC